MDSEAKSLSVLY